MDFDLYNSYVEVTISRRDVEGLVGIWKETAYMGEQGDEFRELIMDSLPYLFKFYSLPLKSSFKEFVEEYDEMMYRKKCDKSPNICLRFFAERGDLRNVKIAIKKGSNDWDLGMYGAAKGGYAELVEFFVEKGADEWDAGMAGAAIGGHLELVEFFIEKGAADWNFGMYGAARGGHEEVVKFFVEKGAIPNDKTIEKFNL